MRKSIIALALFFCSILAGAQTEKVDLRTDLRSIQVTDFFQSTGAKKKRKLNSLERLKDQEIRLEWTECAASAPAVFASQKEVRGWVALSWLHCLEQEQKKKSNPLILEKPLTAIAGHRDLFLTGPWSEELQRRWVSLRLMQLEKQVPARNPKTAAALDHLLSGLFDLNEEQRARVYQALGDLAFAKLNYAEARFFFEEAQNQKDSKYLQEKLEFIMKTAGEASAMKALVGTVEESAGDEQKIEDRMRQSLRSNDSISALKDVIVLLNQYPGSKAAKRLKDKPLEIYNSLSEATSKEKALVTIGEADSARLLDWAQGLHRRGDYGGALYLATKSMTKGPHSQQLTKALWVAGRSAHFLGQYDLALEHFASLVAFHSGSEEAAEALFRASLIHFRKKNFSDAAAFLERLLKLGRERYELLARYWLVRSLQETSPERAKVVATELMERYPFSYYGLRLQAEARGGEFSWPEVKEKLPPLQNEFYLVGAQKGSWLRFKLLSTAGWVNEAQSELVFAPFMKDPTLKVSFAQKLVERHQYSAAIRLINDAMEKDPRLRREEFVKIGYPEVFVGLFNEEAEHYGLQASLLRSLTRQESAFNLRAVSTSDALGLMQMIPSTAQEVAKKLGLKVELPDDMFRPEVNIPMGASYVSQMLVQFQGHVPLALAAYNAGPNRIKTWVEARPETRELMTQPSSLPANEIWFDELPWTETSFYVKAIMRNVLLYRLVSEGSFTPKPVLWQDLLNKKSK